MERLEISKPLRSKGSSRALRGLLLLLLLLVAGFFAWTRWVYLQIEHYAVEDQAAPSDAIAVFGAAEYDGKPSPVYRARLDHAWALYHRGIAPLMITLGGPGGDKFTEGEVGKEYLMSLGVPEEAVIAETVSRDTEESARRIVVIARANGLKRLVIVSDPTHLFRVREICAREGLQVLTSPRQQTSPVGSSSEWQQVWHETVAYTLWRLHLH